MSEDAATQLGVVTVGGQDYEIPEKFTLGELADIEEIIGQEYDPERPGARSTLAVVFIAMRRKNPALRLSDVRGLGAEDIAIQEDEAGPPAQAPSEESASATPEPSGAQP